MLRRLADLFRPHGTIGPFSYLVTGLVAFAIKYAVDQTVATLLVHRPWLPWQYLSPVITTLTLLAQDAVERRFLLVMSLIATPFIWLGITVTMQRLRSLGLPLWLVLLFFIPVINLVFFLVLSVTAERRPAAAQLGALTERDSSWRRDGAVALGISVLLCVPAVWLGTKVLGRYGYGLFIALPFCLGLISTVIFTWRAPRRYGDCLVVAVCTMVVAAGALLAFAVEGTICLVMAAPISFTLALLGATVGYWMQHPVSRRQGAALLLLLALFPPAVMGSESWAAPAPEEFAVRTTIEVSAPPEVVWRHVISFSELPEPPEWMFRAGIAYPMRAEIQGRGVGAVRHCVFSTGPFVEPITVWDEPRRLEFAVTQNPPPLQEWSPYRDLQLPHLNGFMVSHRGRFLLLPTEGGHTRLEGTTWYEHGLWPATYWRAWSDFVIHRIHLRVLRHIRTLSEASVSAR